jgi:hypothetical protein
MKEILVIVAITVGLLFFMAHKDNEFKAECRAKGGVPVIGHYDNTCLAPGVAIEVD